MSLDQFSGNIPDMADMCHMLCTTAFQSGVGVDAEANILSDKWYLGQLNWDTLEVIKQIPEEYFPGFQVELGNILYQVFCLLVLYLLTFFTF